MKMEFSIGKSHTGKSRIDGRVFHGCPVFVHKGEIFERCYLIYVKPTSTEAHQSGELIFTKGDWVEIIPSTLKPICGGGMAGCTGGENCQSSHK